jgi:hypothetical protein
MPDPYLTPNLVITTYRGSHFTRAFTPKQNGAAVDLSSYENIAWTWFAGSRSAPGARILEVASNPVNSANPYITITSIGGFPSILVDIPGAILSGVAPGEYFAELLLTEAGGDVVMTGWATILHQPSTVGL